VTSSPQDRLLEKLASDDTADRRDAIARLGEQGSADVVPHLFRALHSDADEEIRKLAETTMVEIGAIADLTPIGADGWFEQVKQSSPAFETLCDVMGERFVGYALIAGAQITGLTIDQLTPANTVVEFRIGENGPARSMLLPDFRRQLVEWMLSDPPTTERVTLPLDLAQAQRLVGVRYILLAPLHQLHLTKVVVEEAGEAPLAHVVALEDGGEEQVEISSLRSRLREGVRLELAGVRDRPFQLDMDLLDKVEDAADKDDWDEIIGLIGGWPGPLSLLLRTPTGAALDSAERARIGRGLGLLANAYRRTGRSAWAEELYRLGLQFVSDGADGADLFGALGEAMISERRFGEAIAPLRRALALGASAATVGPDLGRALLRRGRTISAMAVLEEARAAGADDDRVLPYVRRAADVLGDVAGSWRNMHESWATDDQLSKIIPALDEDEEFDDSEVTGRMVDPASLDDGSPDDEEDEASRDTDQPPGEDDTVEATAKSDDA